MVLTVATITVGCLKYPSMRVCRLKEVGPLYALPPLLKKYARAKRFIASAGRPAGASIRIHVYESLSRIARIYRGIALDKKMVNR